MTKSRSPTSKDISQLVAFLPLLYAEGFMPVERWSGGTEDQDGAFTFPWPEYNSTVHDFITVASRECWCDYEYRPEDAAHKYWLTRM
jgi:hypothetical protein